MERAAAVVVAGIGLVLLTLAALVFAGPDEEGHPGGVDVAALVTGPLPSTSSAEGRPSGRPTVPADASATSAVVTSAPVTGAPVGAVTSPSPPSPPAPAAPPASPPGVPAALGAVLADISAGAIRFELNRADLDGRARDALDRLAAALVGRPDLVLVVRGYTDASGTPEVNEALSVRRAQVVAEYLGGRGVAAGQLQVVGYGSGDPVADNDSADGRQANRRSDVAPAGGGR